MLRIGLKRRPGHNANDGVVTLIPYCCPESGVNLRHGCLLHPRQNVRVHVQRDARGRVAKPLAHHLHRHPGLQQLTRVGVPQIVKASVETLAANQPTKVAGELHRRPHRAVRAGEDEVQFLAPLLVAV